MIWYKFWRESRIRFYIGMASIAALCLIHIFAEPKFSTQALDRLGVHNYVQYIYRMVYHGQVHALAQLLCMVLGLGGLQRDRKQGTLGFTLALPFGRTRCRRPGRCWSCPNNCNCSGASRTLFGRSLLGPPTVLPGTLAPVCTSMDHRWLCTLRCFCTKFCHLQK